MADHKKATTHHGLAGKALAKGNTKLAAHHMGHAMRALRTDGASPTAPPAPAPLSEEGSPDGDNMTADQLAAQSRVGSAPPAVPKAPLKQAMPVKQPNMGKLTSVLAALRK